MNSLSTVKKRYKPICSRCKKGEIEKIESIIRCHRYSPEFGYWWVHRVDEPFAQYICNYCTKSYTHKQVLDLIEAGRVLE